MDSITSLPGDLLKYYLDGGMVMHMISVLSVFSMTTIIYKLISYRQLKLNLNDWENRLPTRKF